MEGAGGLGELIADGMPPAPMARSGSSAGRPGRIGRRARASGEGPKRVQSINCEEELELALAISASEAGTVAQWVRRPGGRDGREARERQEAEDRDFALALQLQSEGETRRRPTIPSSTPGDQAPAPPRQGGQARPGAEQPTTSSPDELMDSHRCAGCNKWLGFHKWMSALEKKWHTDCFRCPGCRKPIQGKYSAKDGEPYHPECHRVLFHERCKVCNNHLPLVANRISWSEHPFWRQKYCGKHNTDGTPRCTACECLKGRGANWVLLEDGRQLCSSCQETVVVDTEDCQPLYTEILQMYRDLGLTLPSRPPLMLVFQQALNECDALEGHHKGSQTRGMTLAEEYRSIRTVKRSSGWAVRSEMVPVERRHCSVTAILVLYGLPRLLIGSILAHEVMHAYLKLNRITRLSQDVEEGLCQLMALIWLERQDPQDYYEKRLGSFTAHQIRTNPTAVYGDGFRAAHAAFQCYGLTAVVNHVKETQQLPVPNERIK
ncbi:unnamed protein product [Ostreobium quekettii]|uniref:LIM zinc-binding domain-containing protein n=1 Tax=Ostreobium quekettii TaxID=121088 RepID=A0A8S1J477_9CHLO|nr:unnamed protein product [Ostreobium quekettii]|eukprot:evm.model.scf_815EXC.3 EVM.evm.TU.scf_815EXC.3   scf_815EXC:7619-11744(+)